jgi:hypothetical protein
MVLKQDSHLFIHLGPCISGTEACATAARRFLAVRVGTDRRGVDTVGVGPTVYTVGAWAWAGRRRR